LAGMARLGVAGCGGAWRGLAWQAGRGEAGNGAVTRGMFWQAQRSEAGQGPEAWQSRAGPPRGSGRLGVARFGGVRRGLVWRGRHGVAEPGWVRQGEAGVARQRVAGRWHGGARQGRHGFSVKHGG
jgi:hypothetical protein